MRLWSGILLVSVLASCSKKDDDKEKTLSVRPQLLKLPSAATALRPSLRLVSPTGATAQSFTPSSIKISLTGISLQISDNQGAGIYTCDKPTGAECMVEVSKLKDLEDALNAEPVSLPEGDYTSVGISLCNEADNNFQTLQVTGSTEMDGKTYITDTTLGIKEGLVADAQPVTFKFRGCGVTIPLQKTINAELSAEQRAAAEEAVKANPDDPNNDALTRADVDVSLRLLFDSFDFAMAGNVTNDATKQLISYNHTDLTNTLFNDDADAACRGSKTGLFLCTQRTSVYATDAVKPTIDRFAISLKETVAYEGRTLVTDPGSMIYTALIRNDQGAPVAAYSRRSIDYGTEFNNSLPGDENFLGVGKGIVDNGDGTYKLSVGKLADTVTYSAFKAEDHEGSRELNTEQVAYKAKKIP